MLILSGLLHDRRAKGPPRFDAQKLAMRPELVFVAHRLVVGDQSYVLDSDVLLLEGRWHWLVAVPYLVRLLKQALVVRFQFEAVWFHFFFRVVVA